MSGGTAFFAFVFLVWVFLCSGLAGPVTPVNSKSKFVIFVGSGIYFDLANLFFLSRKMHAASKICLFYFSVDFRSIYEIAYREMVVCFDQIKSNFTDT